MALPTERVVTGTYVNPVTGEPYDGRRGEHYVIFEPIPARWTDQNGNQVLLGGGRVNLDENGHFEETVVCTDAPGVLPLEGRAWHLRQFVAGSWAEPAVIVVPMGDGPLDITDVLSVRICGVDYVPVPGPPGSPGAPGTAGPPGSSAYEVAVAEGFVGTEAQWLASLQGEPGDDGQQGEDGPAGDSAYEVAVQEGFSGTEQEWLNSLVGPEGEQGPAGLSVDPDTGVTDGGDISRNGTNPAAVDIQPLRARIVDYFSDPAIVTDVETTTVTTVELDSVALDRTITWLLMDGNGFVYQQGTRPSPTDRRNFIVLGMVAQDNGSIFLAQSIPTITRQPVNQLYDLMDAIGAFGIIGNDVSPNGANLQLNVGAGQVFSRGWNHFDGGTETSSPHVVTTLGATPASWVRALRESDLEHADASTTVDVANYDNVGMLTPIPSGDAAVHQLWMFPTSEGAEVHVLQYGQRTFGTLDDAVSGAGTAAFVTNPALPGNAILLGYLAVLGTATDLSNSTQAVIIKAGKFGAGPGGGASVDLSGYAMLAGAEFTGPITSLLSSPEDMAEASRSTADSTERWLRSADGEMRWGPGNAPADTFLKRLAIGVLAVMDTDLVVGQEAASAIKLKQSSIDLSMEASGADLFVSVFELVEFAGQQRDYLRLESGEFTAHASGKWIFGNGPEATTGHVLDGVANQIGLYGALPVGRQIISGARTTGGALQDLLDALESVGLISDSTTAGPALVETVNGEAGPDVSLGSADVGAIPEASKGVANGVASLGSDGKVPGTQLPSPAVSSVNGETGAVVLDSADIGAIPVTEKGIADGVASLDNTGKVPSAQLPAAPVTSVNGETGTVVLSAADVGALDQATADDLYSPIDGLYYNVLDHGAVGDGTTDDAPAINTLLASVPSGSVVTLPALPYAIGVPIVVPPGKTLMGLRADLMTVTDLYEPVPVIKPTAGFTGVSAIRFLDQATGGYAKISGEQRVFNLTLDGVNVAAGVDGLQAKGNVQNVALRDLTIRRFPNSGIYCGLEGGVGPYSWRMYRVMLDNNHVHGMYAERMVDLTLVDCQAIGNWANGFVLSNAANSQSIGCRSEWNGSHGLYLTGDWGTGQGSGGMIVSSFSTDRNGFNGLYIDATGNAPITVSTIMTRRDGRNGGTGGGGYAGIAVANATMPVMINGWTNYPGVDDGGGAANSPEYGGRFTGNTFVQIDSAYIQGATTSLNTAGGNKTFRLGSTVTLLTGTTAAPVQGTFGDGSINITRLIAANPFTVAHRGSGGEFPEHTMIAYESAVAAGAKAIEVSCCLTADGILVCFHDTTLERMTGITPGSIGTYTYAQLSQFVKIKGSTLLGAGWADQPIPTLENVLDRFLGKVVIFLEAKDNPSVPVMQALLPNRYPQARDTVVWKNYYLAASWAWAKTNGFYTWAYIDANTTSTAMDAIDSNIDMWGVPIAASDAKITEVVGRPGGKPVMVWSVHRHYDVARLTGLGVRGLMEAEWLYLNDKLALTNDQWQSRVKNPGTIGAQPYEPNYALKYDATGRAYITQLPNQAVLMGGHRLSIAKAAGTYSIAYSMTWDNIPGVNLHSGIAFAKPDDTVYAFNAANASGGYHIVFRSNGDLQLYRHTAGNASGTQLGTSPTAAPVAGTKMNFTVTVTPTAVSVTRTDVGPTTVTVNDTTYRGRYWHLSTGSVTVANTTPYFDDIVIT